MQMKNDLIRHQIQTWVTLTVVFISNYQIITCYSQTYTERKRESSSIGSFCFLAKFCALFFSSMTYEVGFISIRLLSSETNGMDTPKILYVL